MKTVEKIAIDAIIMQFAERNKQVKIMRRMFLLFW